MAHTIVCDKCYRQFEVAYEPVGREQPKVCPWCKNELYAEAYGREKKEGDK